MVKETAFVSPTDLEKSSTYGASDETYYSARQVSLSISLEGTTPSSGDWLLLTVFNGHIVMENKWSIVRDNLHTELPIDLKDSNDQLMITEQPLIFLLRTTSEKIKSKQDPDPLLHTENRAGASVDMFPLLIGEDEIFLQVPLLFKDSGLPTECVVNVRIVTTEPSEETITSVPFLITMVSAHCLPIARDGTVYVGAIALDNVLEKPQVKFGLSLSTSNAKKSVWATASAASQAANTAISAPNDDIFVPVELILRNTDDCRSFYWNAMNRRRVDPDLLRARLAAPLYFELAGVPKTGKIDVRGRYMAYVDAGALLQPGIHSVTVCSRILLYNEDKVSESVKGMLEIPPSSARQSARNSPQTDLVIDEHQHSTYIVIRFDLWEALVPKVKMVNLFKTIGLQSPKGPSTPFDLLDPEPPREDPTIDVRKIRKEGGALAVHKELSGLACRGAVPMNQGIKRTAANRLLMRVRSMLKQFPPGDCSNVEWQDTVTKQHAASRRAVSSSFAPQSPLVRAPPRVAAARCRMAGDMKISDEHIEEAEKSSKTTNPRSIICKALRSLEERYDLEALDYVLEGLNACPRNRFLLWLFGGQQFDKGIEANEIAAAALRISVKGDYSDGTANVIGWAALHTLYHCNKEPYAAFVAARRMRKSYELPCEWSKFYQRWIEESGEEEVYWFPTVVSSRNPFLIAAAFFLCLRCFTFTEMILGCVERGCASIGSRLGLVTKISPDIDYIRAASLILRQRFDDALQVTTEAIGSFGPNAMMSQMRTVCMSCIRGWDGECKIALECAEKAGAVPSPALLLKAALGGINSNPEAALQRAARAHRAAPSGHSALVIARIYAKMNEIRLAERWAAASVKCEPLLADGWAMLALLAMYEKSLDKARTMLRTAKQVGNISPDINEEVKAVMDIVNLEGLPEALVTDLCFCEYY